ncbi:ABC transporter ATP-binding protein [Intestinimonas butyriciproducens]|uniref:ABC transporter ATP-binding protein n=1 Tax=Intestinimonas butyriciproducens TaxID=1297617 RepID=UPI001FB02A38|nr:ATP-binding cassette domain-containing protein [Intestinimonas butyriciproducens]
MIIFDHVTYAYEGKETPSLRDCTFSVKPGELILLTGESGCGKTTIIKLVNGLLQHTGGGTLAGTVMVGGQDVAQTPLWELARTVGSVFQNPKSQFFNLDTTSEVLFGLESRGASHDEMAQALESAAQVCGVGPLLERSIFALSGGEKQRIACASAWAMGPELFVLDEPSSNLDGEGIRQLREILKQLKKARKTVLMAEHRLWYAADLADRVFYLRSGQLEREYYGKDFLALPEEERRSMGLRSIAEIPVSAPGSSTAAGADGLTVRELRAAYHGATVWEGVSFHAPRGQITAITGQNGAGKTTLARCLCGLMKEQSGTIFWDGKPLRRTERRRKAFLIMQDVNLQLFGDSVLAEVRLGNTATEQEALTTLGRMDLAQYADTHPMALSGGQKQRLAVADGCLSGKELLIFDEPTSGLDYGHMLEVSRRLRELAEQGLCVVVITHDGEFLRESGAWMVDWLPKEKRRGTLRGCGSAHGCFMLCIKCGASLPEGANFCHMCGKKQIPQKRKPLKRPNGSGTVYKLSGHRKRPWVAAKNRVIIGYYEKKTDALQASERLSGVSLSDRFNMTFAEVYAQWSPEHFKTIGPKGVEAYENSFQIFSSLHDTKFRDLRTSDFQEIFFSHWKNPTPLSPNTSSFSHRCILLQSGKKLQLRILPNSFLFPIK